jgi:hypothetical protein
LCLPCTLCAPSILMLLDLGIQISSVKRINSEPSQYAFSECFYFLSLMSKYPHLCSPLVFKQSL